MVRKGKRVATAPIKKLGGKKKSSTNPLFEKRAKTRLDPIRSMAKIHQTPATTICPPSSIEGSSINQPVQPNFGQTNRHPIVQIGRQVRSRKQSREKRTTRRPS